MFKVRSLLLLLSIQLGHETAGLSIPILSDIQDVIGLAHDISGIVSGNVPFLSIFTGSKPDPVEAKLAGLSKQIDELSNLFHIKIDHALSEILSNVPRATDFRSRMGQLSTYITRINFLYDKYQKIIRSSNNYTQLSKDQFVEAATSLHDGDIPETLNQMYELFAANQLSGAHESFLDVATSVFMKIPKGELCGNTKSQQQRVYDIYRMIVYTEVKGFIMTSYAYGMLSIYNNISFATEIKSSEETLISRTAEYLAATKSALVRLPRDIYICDPPRHIKDETYADMQGAIQRVVVHEWMVRSPKDCYGSCSTVDSQKVYRNFSYPNPSRSQTWAPKKKCEGRINECQDLNEVQFCEMEAYFRDRFVYIKSDLGYYGNEDSCFFATKTELDSFLYEATLFNARWCEPCLCTCTEEKSSSTAHRALSLRPQRTDLGKKMVLTGIRFQRKDGVIHLQIEQGKLISNGRIEEGSTSWLPLKEFKYRPETSWQGGFAIDVDGEEKPLKEDEDYLFIQYDRRRIHFDHVAPFYPNYVITGAQLNRSRNDPKAIGINVRITKFNFTTGEFITELDQFRHSEIPDALQDGIPSVWLTEDYIRWNKELVIRANVNVKGKMSPVHSYGHVPGSGDNSQVDLTYSNEKKEVGQSTIPYFDTQIVAPTPRVALDGLGIYHRGNGESGGFISFKVVTHDISKYLNPTVDTTSLKAGELEDIQAEEAGSEM